MEVWQIILIVFGAYFLVMFLFSLLIYIMMNVKMKNRQDKNPLFKYFTTEDYPGLEAKTFTFKNDKGLNLSGRLYTRKGLKDDTYLVFFHGYGGGHEAYTTLINDLVTTLEMPLLTFDYTGCDLSAGKNIIHIVQPLVDAHSFLAYLQTVPTYKGKKLVLIGHSWGGYVATNLYPFNKDKNIIKVVDLNGVTDFGLYIKTLARAPYLFVPMFRLFSAFKYGKFAFATTRDSIKNTPIPHLIMHGEKDVVVPFTPFISSLVLQKDKYSNIKFHFENDKNHLVYLTVDGEKHLGELMSMTMEYNKQKVKDEELKEKIINYDFTKTVENDAKTLEVIKKFVKGE
jgi:pimeloyl-ACP methyl ester carboxylesterase